MKSQLCASIFICLLPSILCVFNNTFENGEENEFLMRRRKVKSCHLVDYTGYNTPQRCCQEPPSSTSGVADLLATICNDDLPFDSDYLFEYKINELQTYANHFTIEYGKEKQISQEFAKAACIADCAAGLVNMVNPDGTLNTAILLTAMVPTAPAAWQPVITEAITACQPSMDMLANIEVTLYEEHKPPQQCPIITVAFIQCVQAYLIGRCPASLQLANPDTKCVDEIEGIDKCMIPYNFPLLFPPTSESNSNES